MRTVIAILTVSAAFSAAASSGADRTEFRIDESTGAVAAFSGGGRRLVEKLENRYLLMDRTGDVEAFERDDTVVKKMSGDGWVSYRCRNAKLSGVEIVKRYRHAVGGLERTLAFRSAAGETRFVTPFTECRLERGFLEGMNHFGAGYIGPYKPFPEVDKPVKVEEYLQSSKGLVFIDPAGRKGSFAHFRTKIDNTPVFPWWHSTIGHYRERHDRLWYVPGGYRMALGTFALQPGRAVAVTDFFSSFNGGIFAFFDKVFARNPDFARELRAIPPPPAWIDNIAVNADDRNFAASEWFLKMLDDGEVMIHLGPAIGLFSWGDYRLGRGGMPTVHGGWASDGEIREFVKRFRRLSPRAKVSLYGIVISAAGTTEVVKSHPEWFRFRDRAGGMEPLFPGVSANWQTMFSESDCRTWMTDMLCAFADDLGLDLIYLDETQMTNSIDWERGRVTRDDDTVKFWRMFAGAKDRRGKAFFANGSGIPYVDVNYIEECRGTLKPEKWRDGAGVLLGVAMMNRLRPAQRTIPLYWAAGNDYANRVLALGWIPRAHLAFGNELAVIRAAYQTGAMLPADVAYTPDWKCDGGTEIESYASRRIGTGDVVISFINRATAPEDVKVGIELSTLGFAAGARINIFRQHLDLERAGSNRTDMVSDRELKENWIRRGIVAGSRLSDPELVYSGPPKGTFAHTVKLLAPGRMEQFVVVESPAAIYAENGLPLNAFVTSRRKSRIFGRRVDAERPVDLVLIDRERDFADITANGAPAKVRTVGVGDLTAKLVSLGPGEWRLDWREIPRGKNAAAELPVAGPKPASSVPPPVQAWYPEVNIAEKLDIETPSGVKVTGRYVYIPCMDPANRLQSESGIGFSAAAADEKELVLTVGTTRREGEIEGMATFSGFGLEGAERLELEVTGGFGSSVPTLADSGHAAPWTLRHHPAKVFAGIVVDYRAGGKYMKRVAFSLGLMPGGRFAMAEPKWGAGRSPDECHALGDHLEGGRPETLVLDLRRYAPRDWDGGAIVSLGTACIQANRTLKLEFKSLRERKSE